LDNATRSSCKRMSKSNPPKDDNEVESHVLEKYEVLSKLGKVREFALVSSL
jgi:hypothetical protein